MRLVIDNGRVGCARRQRDVAVEECFDCFAFRRLSRAGQLICEPRPMRAALEADLVGIRPLIER